MSVIKVGKGRRTVTITGPLAEDLEREIRELLGPVADELQRAIDEVLAEAKKVWPVVSGKSRDSLKTAIRFPGDGFLVEVIAYSDERYVKFIKSTKVGKRQDATRLRSPFVAHVRTPALGRRRELRRRLPLILAEAIEDGVLT